MVRRAGAGLVILLAALAAGSTSDLAGQTHAGAIGLTLGGSVHGDLTPGLSRTTEFESGWIAGLQYERWIGTGRVGVRLSTLFTQRLLDSSPGGDYNVFMGDVGAMVRILPVREDRRVSPFAALGLGATHYGSVAGSGPLAGGVYGENATRLHLLVSIGADVATSGAFGLRAELGDEIIFPSIGYSPSFNGFPNVHNLLATVAIQYRIGRLSGPGDAATRPVSRPPAMPSPEPGPEPEQAGEEAARPSPVVERLRAEVDSLESRVAELQRQVDSLQNRIAELEGQAQAEAADTAPAPPEASAQRAVYTVQISAFLDPERADRLTAEMQADGVPTWRWDAVTRNRTFSRVRVGALPTREAAERLARFLAREKGLSFWVDRIEPAEDVPPGAVDETLAYLNARR